MHSALVSGLALWAALTSPALAADFNGTFAGGNGKVILKQQGTRVTGSGTVDGLAGKLDGALQDDLVVGTYRTADGQGVFQAALQGDTLYLSFDGDAPLTFSRSQGASIQPAQPAPAPQLAAAGPAPASATGKKFRSELDGYELKAPKNWKLAEQAGRILLGSDTEPGLIVAWYVPGMTFEQMQKISAQGLNQEGVLLAPQGSASGLKVKAGQALAVDLAGTSKDNIKLQAHAVGIAGERGAIAILGVTTPAQFDALWPKVQQVAASVAFFKPRAGSGTQLLRGALCNWSGGSVASSTRRMTFDGQGRVGWGSEFAAGGNFVDSGGNNTGNWGAIGGNQYAASSVGTYSVEGNRVLIRWPSEVNDCVVNFRQTGGRITEIKCGDRLYGAGLCE